MICSVLLTINIIKMDKYYKGLETNLERFKDALTDEKTKLLFKIAYKQGYDEAINYTHS